MKYFVSDSAVGSAYGDLWIAEYFISFGGTLITRSTLQSRTSKTLGSDQPECLLGSRSKRNSAAFGIISNLAARSMTMCGGKWLRWCPRRSLRRQSPVRRVAQEKKSLYGKVDYRTKGCAVFASNAMATIGLCRTDKVPAP